MGDRHHDPTDHFRTTQPHAGITMKDNLFWPGFILLAVALLGTVAGALWFVVECRRVTRIDEQWNGADAKGAPRQHIAG
jgi:hypothetical protein